MFSKSYIKSFLLLSLVYFALPITKANAQKQYTFNTQGSACHFQYLCYAPDFYYNSRKRPLIFYLAAGNESLEQTFEKDELKNIPEFSRYFFVYVPNKGGTAENKLHCLQSLSSLLSFNYEQGCKNIFLFINDSTISQGDIDDMRLQQYFQKIRLSGQEKKEALPEVTEDFKAVEIKTDIKVEEELGTFFIDEYTDTYEEDTWLPEMKKSYFGPPTAFQFTLSGIVKDKSSGEALPFATVYVKGTNIGATSNADGYFSIPKVPSDTSTLIASYIGYEKTEVFLTPQFSRHDFSIKMSSSAQKLKAVTVTASREQLVLASKTDINIVRMSPRKLEQLPNLGEKDVMRSFQLMPGISASNESSSGLYVRGGTPDQNLVIYDGFTVYQVDHLYGFFSAFNPHAIKDVQLFKGGFEPRFGGRLSSVTEITGKDGNQKRINAGIDLSLLSVNAFAEIPIGSRFSSIITYRRSFKGFLYETIFEKFNESSTAANQASLVEEGPGGNRFSQESEVTSYFYDLNGKLTFRPGDKDIITLSVFKGTDMLDNSMSSQMPSMGGGEMTRNMSATDITTYGNMGGSLKWSRRWSPKVYGNTVLSYSNYFSDRERSQDMQRIGESGESDTTKTGLFENNDLKDFSIKSDYQWDILNFMQLQYGIYSSYYDIDYSYAQSDTLNLLNKNNKGLLSGAYIQTKLKLFNDKLNLLPGIRASHYSITNKLYFEPRASFTFNISDKLSYKGAWGKFYQFTNRVTREDILSGSKDFWMLSDGNAIPVSTAEHYITGLSYENTDILLSVEAYYKKIANLTEYSLRFNPNPQGVDFNEDFYVGDNYAKGIEILAQKKSGKINGWISYTLGEVKSRFNVYSDDYYAANQDATHEFKIVTQYQYKRWDFAATWVYATGRPYTAPSGAYTITLLDGTEQEYFTVTEKNGMRLPDYHRMDFSVNYKILAGAKGDRKRKEIGHIGFSLFNLYNKKNVWYKQFVIDDGQILETNVNYLGITPNLSLSLKLW